MSRIERKTTAEAAHKRLFNAPKAVTGPNDTPSGIHKDQSIIER